MKYSLDILINQPRERVASLFADPEHLPEWQAGLLRYETLEGEPGTEGARSVLRYQIGKKQFEMHETIVSRRPPEEYRMLYEARGVWNQVVNRFTEVEPGVTRWQVETEFRVRGLMWFMSLVMPGMFKTQTENYMRQFKIFAERDGDAEAGAGGEQAVAD